MSEPSAKRAKTNENGKIKLYRSYPYDEIPDIAFYGISKEEIKPYIKDEMQKQGSYSPFYYEFSLGDNYKLLDLSSDKGQDLLKVLFNSNEPIMNKAFQLEEDKYIRKSDNKEDDVKAFELIKDTLLPQGFVGTMTSPSARLSHSEVVIFNKELIGELNVEGNKKTDIVVTPKVIRKQKQRRHFSNNIPKPRMGALSFNSSLVAESEDKVEFSSLRLSFPPLLDNSMDNHPESPVKERQSRTQPNSTTVVRNLFSGGKRRSVNKSKKQKKTKRRNSIKKQRRTKKKKTSNK